MNQKKRFKKILKELEDEYTNTEMEFNKSKTFSSSSTLRKKLREFKKK